ncbi:M4 family metallopeptidase [Streptomyces clavuligerus]|uniref:Neutral metalloproteinase n=1 Tax=Streptomyces clavuligerus TaxID=1901 RepID=B5H0F4_STRCL|nr:M4 family metallopeptidase [Streptomyces clavuligerus]ANW20283.1 peptidase M4 [Streptomyces clavuligerus]AXU14910.1 M4 family peptidase [Streptomyces clavuligerus]EDY52050.1 metalloprotease [Streptomyces clavuligerus]EFG06783.1 metalloprotease [Streptomyces clavuligerus]MBY6304951.1 M4 family metallopeptidase [Streptomyces clavuligerus]
MANSHPTFCTIIPPHVLDKVATSGDPDLAPVARHTLETDAKQRTRRQLNIALGVPDEVGIIRGSGPTEHPTRTLHDCGNSTRLPGAKVRDEGQDPGQDATVNRVYAGLGSTFELLLSGYGRSSLDGEGLPLVASVHYGRGYANAFWNGQQMVFGDGDGEVFLDFSQSVDVIAHELTHGLTQYTANLTYFGQPGALNESVSDVIGSLVKQYVLDQTADRADWLLGAEILGPRVNGAALRSLKAPGTAYDDEILGKDPQPATMDGYVRTGRDNGGVHINSGIPNHAFYLAATELGGKAWERAGQIWFDTLTGGALHEDATFRDFAGATLDAARERYGDGEELQAVTKAWATVKVPTG